MDPANVGVIVSGWEDLSAIDCPSATDIVMHYKKIFEGYILQVVAPLPRHYLGSIPIADQVKGAGFRPAEIASLPVSGAFKFESVTPGAELRMKRNDGYTGWKSGKPAHLDALVFKWYGDPDAMIAGFRNGEIDVATDLQDSDLPKVQDLGDAVSAIPSLTYEFLRPNWYTADGLMTRPRSAAAPRTRRLPIAGPAAR